MRNDNDILLSALSKYLLARRWGVLNAADGRYAVYQNSEYEKLSIVLPDHSVAGHKQSRGMLDEAVEIVASIERVGFSMMNTLLLNSDYDHFSLRESGAIIKHGAIGLASGLSVISNIYSLFKVSASSSINIKGKRRLTAEYLDSIRLLAPNAGSFIFNFDSKLYQPQGAEHPILNTRGVSSVGRLVNLTFANKLKKIKSILDSDQSRLKADLLRDGISYRYCHGLSEIFIEEADRIEFGFNWSFLEPAAASAPASICFDREDRVSIIEFSRLLMNHSAEKVINVPAYLESFTRKEGELEGKVHIRFSHGKKDLSTSVIVDGALYNKLNELHVNKKKVLVSGNLFYSEGSRAKVEAFEVKKITLPDEVTFSLF